MKRVAVVLCFAGIVGSLMAQTVQPNISFVETSHDFGKLQEEKGKVTYRFEFVNSGGSDLLVQKVTASCGCTAPQWTREPIPPGGKGFVAATFNPAGRPGPFRKFINVASNSDPTNVRLTIVGEVEPKPRTVEDDYQYEMGPMRLKTNHLAFGNLKNTQMGERSIEVINTSSEKINIAFDKVPPHISVKAEPASLMPGQKGNLVATYNTPMRHDWGFVIDRMGVLVNGASERNYSLVISANIEEDFSSMSPEDLANAPVLNTDGTEFNFGKIAQGEKREHTFILTNSGNSDLQIRKVKASCGCTAVQPAKRVVAPGESVDIKTVFNSAGKVGNQNKTVTIITNDPNNSKLILWVKGEVTKS